MRIPGRLLYDSCYSCTCDTSALPVILISALICNEDYEVSLLGFWSSFGAVSDYYIPMFS